MRGPANQKGAQANQQMAKRQRVNPTDAVPSAALDLFGDVSFDPYAYEAYDT